MIDYATLTEQLAVKTRKNGEIDVCFPCYGIRKSELQKFIIGEICIVGDIEAKEDPKKPGSYHLKLIQK